MRYSVVFILNSTSFFISHRINIAKEILKLNGEVILCAPNINPSEKDILFNSKISYLKIPFSRKKIKILDLLKTILFGFRVSKMNKIYHLVTIIPILLCGIPLRILNKKVVFAVSGLGTVFISEQIFSKIIRFFVKNIYRFLFNGVHSRLIVQNNDDYYFFRNELKIDEKNIYLIKGSGVSQLDFQFFEELPPDNRFPVILVPARVIKEKGIFEIVGASQILVNEGFIHEVWVAGDVDFGNPSSLTQEQIEKISIANPSIKFLGHQSNMKPLFQLSTMVCLPSYREGLPKALIEAAACGRPIITCDTPGCRDIVGHMQTGILVKTKSAEELSRAIKRLYLDKELMEKLRKNAYQKFLNEFNEEIIVRQTISVYSSFLS